MSQIACIESCTAISIGDVQRFTSPILDDTINALGKSVTHAAIELPSRSVATAKSSINRSVWSVRYVVCCSALPDHSVDETPTTLPSVEPIATTARLPLAMTEISVVCLTESSPIRADDASQLVDVESQMLEYTG